MTELFKNIAKDSGIYEIENSLTEYLIAKAASQILYSMIVSPQEDSTLCEKAARSDVLRKLGINPVRQLMNMFVKDSAEMEIVSKLAIPVYETLQLVCVSKNIAKDPHCLYKAMRRALTKNIVF